MARYLAGDGEGEDRELRRKVDAIPPQPRRAFATLNIYGL